MKLFFRYIGTAIKVKLGSILEKLTQCQIQREQMIRFDMNQDECENQSCASTHFIQTQKNQLTDYRSIWNDFAMYYLCLFSTLQNMISIKSNPICYPLLLTNEILNLMPPKKRNHFISFKYCDVQLQDIVSFPDGALGLDSFLKAYKNLRNKKILPYE